MLLLNLVIQIMYLIPRDWIAWTILIRITAKIGSETDEIRDNRF